MENKMVRVPFAVEIAKKITNGEVNGNIVTRDGRSARIVCWDLMDTEDRILALVEQNSREEVYTLTSNGLWREGEVNSASLTTTKPHTY